MNFRSTHSDIHQNLRTRKQHINKTVQTQSRRHNHHLGGTYQDLALFRLFTDFNIISTDIIEKKIQLTASQMCRMVFFILLLPSYKDIFENIKRRIYISDYDTCAGYNTACNLDTCHEKMTKYVNDKKCTRPIYNLLGRSGHWRLEVHLYKQEKIEIDSIPSFIQNMKSLINPRYSSRRNVITTGIQYDTWTCGYHTLYVFRHLLNIEVSLHHQNVVMRQSTKRSHSAPATLRARSARVINRLNSEPAKTKPNSTKVTRRRNSAPASMKVYTNILTRFKNEVNYLYSSSESIFNSHRIQNMFYSLFSCNTTDDELSQFEDYQFVVLEDECLFLIDYLDLLQKRLQEYKAKRTSKTVKQKSASNDDSQTVAASSLSNMFNYFSSKTTNPNKGERKDEMISRKQLKKRLDELKNKNKNVKSFLHMADEFNRLNSNHAFRDAIARYFLTNSSLPIDTLYHCVKHNTLDIERLASENGL